MSKYVDDDREMPRFRVNRITMVDPDILAEERAKVFDKVWLYIGHESELLKPNDFKLRTVAGRPMIFARDASGELRVWLNSCPHRGAAICREPEGNSRFFTCFYHGWTFNVAGEQVSMPGDDRYGGDFVRPDLAKPPRMESYRGFVFVSLNPDVEPLVEYLAGAREYLDLICDQSEVGMQVIDGKHEYSCMANWKLLVENSVDGYHALSTHQRYFEMVVAARGPINVALATGGTAVALGNGHAVAMAAPGSGDLLGRPLSEEGKLERDARMERLRAEYGDGWVERLQGTRNLVIFPNLIVIDLVMGVLIRQIEPVSPDRIAVTGWELVPKEDSPELIAQRLDNFLTFWGPGGLASPDDVEALESAQRAFATIKELEWSDISRGMANDEIKTSDELQMRTWWRRWNELMTGEVSEPEDHGPLYPPYDAVRESRQEAAAAN